MKKIYLLAALLLGISIADAQLVTGSKLLGGAFNLNFSNSENNTTNPGTDLRSSAASFQISLMKVRNPHLLHGFGLNFLYNHTKNLPSNFTANSFGVGGFYAVTKLVPLATKFSLALTGTAGADYVSGKTFMNSATNYDRYNVYNVGLNGTLGLWYQLNQRLLFTADLSNLFGLYYSHNSTDNYAGSVVTRSGSNSIGLRTGLTGFSLNSVNVGVRYILK